MNFFINFLFPFLVFLASFGRKALTICYLIFSVCSWSVFFFSVESEKLCSICVMLDIKKVFLIFLRHKAKCTNMRFWWKVKCMDDFWRATSFWGVTRSVQIGTSFHFIITLSVCLVFVNHVCKSKIVFLSCVHLRWYLLVEFDIVPCVSG